MSENENAVAKGNGSHAAVSIQGYLNSEKVKGYLDGVLKERAGQFVASLVSLANLTPGLMKCDPKSLMMCGLKAAALNLPLDNNLGFAYAIPYGDHAQFQMGYRAFVQLAMRTGLYKSINVIDIREGELQRWDALSESLDLKMIDDDNARSIAPVIGYAAMFELSNGFRKVLYKKRDALMAHGKRFSKTYAKGPWSTDTDAMCKKTLVKELLSKWGPLSTEIMEGIKYDQSVITENGEPAYCDTQNEIPYEEPTYDAPPELLEQIHTAMEILGLTLADGAMRLGACKGDIAKLEALLKDLSLEIDKKNGPTEAITEPLLSGDTAESKKGRR